MLKMTNYICDYLQLHYKLLQALKSISPKAWTLSQSVSIYTEAKTPPMGFLITTWGSCAIFSHSLEKIHPVCFVPALNADAMSSFPLDKPMQFRSSCGTAESWRGRERGTSSVPERSVR